MVKDLSIKWSRSFLNVYHAATHKTLRELFFTGFLFNAGFTFFTTFFSVYLIQKFHFTQGNIGDFFAYVGIWVAITQALLVPFFAKRFAPKTLVTCGLFGTGAAIFLFFLPHEAWQLLLITPLMAISNGMIFANLTAIISRSVGPSVQGEVLGINASVSSLAMSIPPILSGYIAASISASAPIWIAGTVIVFAAFFFMFFYRPKLPTPLEDVA